MDKNSNSFTLIFAVVVCVVLATALASSYNGLKPTIDANAAFDKKKNVLLAMGLAEKGATDVSRKELARIYEEQVEGKVVEIIKKKQPETVWRDSKAVQVEVDRVVDVVETDYSIDELAALQFAEQKKKVAVRREYREVYRATGADGKTVWCIPISGYGLWSTLYGFLALEGDCATVRGITFYKHAETPGLGGEVDNVSWQEKWVGKKTLDEDGDVVGITVKKGKVDDKVRNEKLHMVDGLSGATITSDGVTAFVKRDLDTFEPYFEKHRN